MVYKLKSLWPAIYLHVILNIAGLLLNEYAQEDIAVWGNVIGFIISLVVVIYAVRGLPVLEKAVIYIKDNQDEVEPVPKV